MKVLVDLNVLMDVLQRRVPFFASAAALCAWGEKRQNTLAVPAHAVTTVSYIVRKTAGAEAEGKALDWLLGNFAVIPADAAVFRFARTLGMEDFEDAVVAASAATVIFLMFIFLLTFSLARLLNVVEVYLIVMTMPLNSSVRSAMPSASSMVR